MHDTGIFILQQHHLTTLTAELQQHKYLLWLKKLFTLKYQVCYCYGPSTHCRSPAETKVETLLQLSSYDMHTVVLHDLPGIFVATECALNF